MFSGDQTFFSFPPSGGIPPSVQPPPPAAGRTLVPSLDGLSSLSYTVATVVQSFHCVLLAIGHTSEVTQTWTQLHLVAKT